MSSTAVGGSPQRAHGGRARAGSAGAATEPATSQAGPQDPVTAEAHPSDAGPPAADPADAAPPHDEPTGDGPVTRDSKPRAARTLIYVPGLSRDRITSAEVVARSIAASADKFGTDVVLRTGDTVAAPPGLRSVGTIYVDAKPHMDVLELDYRRTVELLDMDDTGSKESVPPGIFVNAFYAAKGIGLAWRARGRPMKSSAARAQVGLGLVGAAILFLALVITAIGAALALVGGVGPEEWLTGYLDSTVGVTAAGIVTTLYVTLRASILRSGQQIRRVLRYLDEPDVALEISRRVGAGVDALADQGYRGEVHLLGYSFGSVVILDDLVPGRDMMLRNPRTELVRSLVTVGCPHDLLLLYFPERFQERWPVRPDLAWRNVFVGSDVFASNFRNEDDTSSGVTHFASGWQVDSFNYLPGERLDGWALAKLAGFRKHTVYWDAGGGCWDMVLDLWGFDAGIPVPIPVIPAGPVDPQPETARQPDSGIAAMLKRWWAAARWPGGRAPDGSR